MTQSQSKISEEQFLERYRPLPNELNDNASFDFGDGGCLYETYGAELEHIKLQSKSFVWTIIEGENSLVIVNGVYRVNRLGYLITAEPWADDIHIEIELEKGDEQ